MSAVNQSFKESLAKQSLILNIKLIYQSARCIWEQKNRLNNFFSPTITQKLAIY